MVQGLWVRLVRVLPFLQRFKSMRTTSIPPLNTRRGLKLEDLRLFYTQSRSVIGNTKLKYSTHTVGVRLVEVAHYGARFVVLECPFGLSDCVRVD